MKKTTLHSLIFNRSQGSAKDEMNCVNELLERNVSRIIVISLNMSGIRILSKGYS